MKPTKKEKRKHDQSNIPQQNIPKKKDVTSYFPLFIFCVGFLLYANTVQHDYALDDIAIIEANAYTKQGIKGIPLLISKGYWHGFNGSNDHVYRPVSPVTFALEYELFGKENPNFSHFVNVVLFAFTGVLLFVTLRKLFDNYNYVIPLTVSLLYVTHPIHTEVVANIKSRDEIFSFLGMISSLLFLLKYSSEKTSKIKHLILSCLCFMGALLSKESAIAFVGAIPLFYFFIKKTDIKKSLLVSIPLILTALIYLILRASILDTLTGQTIDVKSNTLATAANLMDRYASTVLLLGKYFQLLTIPYPLNHDYSYNQIPINTWADAYAIGSLIFYICLIGFIVYAVRKQFNSVEQNSAMQNQYTNSFIETCAIGIGFYLVTMSIVSNVFILIGANLAERFLFTPSLGYCFLLGALLIKLTKTDVFSKKLSLSTHRKLLILFIPILVGYSFKTVSRNMAWKDNYTLFSTDIITSPNSARINNAIGSVLTEMAAEEKDETKRKELIDKAMPVILKSIEIYPYYQDAHFNLGTAYGLLNDNEKALENYNKAVQYGSTFWKLYNNMGIIYTRVKQYDKAILNLQKALKYNPQNVTIYYQLAEAYKNAGDINSAKNTYNKLIASKLADEVTYINISRLCLEAGQLNDAIPYLQKLIQINPNNVDGYYNLGVVYQQRGEAVKAKQYFDKAFQLNPALKK